MDVGVTSIPCAGNSGDDLDASAQWEIGTPLAEDVCGGRDSIVSTYFEAVAFFSCCSWLHDCVAETKWVA